MLLKLFIALLLKSLAESIDTTFENPVDDGTRSF